MRPDYPAEELKRRSKEFAVRVVKLSQALPGRREAWVLGKQVLRSGTSGAANYRAACRARSRAEFVAKIGIVVEEIDETVFWLELLVETGLVPKERMAALLAEANELLAIFAASLHTARIVPRRV
jgi:four helix bundle protein